MSIDVLDEKNRKHTNEKEREIKNKELEEMDSINRQVTTRNFTRNSMKAEDNVNHKNVQIPGREQYSRTTTRTAKLENRKASRSDQITATLGKEGGDV